MQKQQPNMSDLNSLESRQTKQKGKQQTTKTSKTPQSSAQSMSHLIIQLMKKTRKNSPLFKPIKKLKTSIQVIGGQDQVSFYQPSSTLIVFHFGLGNDVDKQLILNGTMLGSQGPNASLIKDFVVLPGKPFTFIEFLQVNDAVKFIKVNNMVNIFQELDTGNSKNAEEKIQTKEQEGAQMKVPHHEQDSKVKQQKQQANNAYKHPLVFYSNLKHNNLQRMMIFFYLNKPNTPQSTQNQHQLVSIPNCLSKYSPQNQIPGLHLIQQIITKEQQLHLLQWLDQQPWQKLSNRRVQHYGFEFKYGQNGVDKDQLYKHQMPNQLQFLLERLKQLVKSISGQQIDYDQLTVNDYFAGHGIPAHFDTHSPFEQYFVAISMLSGIVMDWKKYDGTQKSTYLKQRSVVVFSGQARFAWLHSIACRKLDNIDNQLRHRSRRISLTFRKIRRVPCDCKYYFYCDSQGYDQNTMKKNNPLLTKYLCEENKLRLNEKSEQEIYSEYVIKAYNSFGWDFHNRVIPEIKQYLREQSLKAQYSHESTIVLDIGCGNGEYKNHLQSNNFYYIGVERCQVMLPVDQQAHMDGLKLCFKDSQFDIVLLIAVLHHFVSQKDRLQCLKQARRVMNPKGVMYLTVFNYESKRQQYPQQDILLDYCLPSHKATINSKNQKDSKQLNVTKQKIYKQQGKKTQKGQIYTRYYHLFNREQLEHLIEKAGLKICSLKMTKENIVVKIKNSKAE